MSGVTVYIITEGKGDNLLCRAFRKEWGMSSVVSMEFELKNTDGRGNPYLVFGNVLRDWLGDLDYTLVVADVRSGTLSASQGPCLPTPPQEWLMT